jgi:hypothetical protein
LSYRRWKMWTDGGGKDGDPAAVVFSGDRLL